MTSFSSPAPSAADAASGDALGTLRGSDALSSAVGTSPVSPGGASGPATPLDTTASRTNAAHAKDVAGQQVSAEPVDTGSPDTGRIGTEILDTAGLLTPDGAVRLDVGQRPDDADINAALCSYVFGAPEDVGSRAGLAAAPTLGSVSGYHVEDADAAGDLDAARGFVLCGYLVDRMPLVALEVGHSNDPWTKGKNVLVRDGSLQAVVSYSPVYQGEPIPEAAATAWLGEALGRVQY